MQKMKKKTIKNIIKKERRNCKELDKTKRQKLRKQK